jgi:hypothetical protein
MAPPRVDATVLRPPRGGEDGRSHGVGGPPGGGPPGGGGPLGGPRRSPCLSRSLNPSNSHNNGGNGDGDGDGNGLGSGFEGGLGGGISIRGAQHGGGAEQQLQAYKHGGPIYGNVEQLRHQRGLSET